jgi:hypothetical protein
MPDDERGAIERGICVSWIGCPGCSRRLARSAPGAAILHMVDVVGKAGPRRRAVVVEYLRLPVGVDAFEVQDARILHIEVQKPEQDGRG